jgi:hypothetical protein
LRKIGVALSRVGSFDMNQPEAFSEIVFLHTRVLDPRGVK